MYSKEICEQAFLGKKGSVFKNVQEMLESVGFFTLGLLRNFTIPILLHASPSRRQQICFLNLLDNEILFPNSLFVVLINYPSEYIWELSYCTHCILLSPFIVAIFSILDQFHVMDICQFTFLCAVCVLLFFLFLFKLCFCFSWCTSYNLSKLNIWPAKSCILLAL